MRNFQVNQAALGGKRIHGVESAQRIKPLNLLGSRLPKQDVLRIPHTYHILDIFLEHWVNVTCIFSPEHGFKNLPDA